MPRTPSPSIQFAKWLAQVASPVYWVDAQRRIRFGNEACTTWTGVEPSKLAEFTCNYHSPSTDEPLSTLIADLCPPPSAFAGTMQIGRLTIRMATGELSRRRATFLPLVASDNDDAAVVVVVSKEELSADDEAGPSEAVTSEELHEALQAWRNERDGRQRVDALVGVSPAIRRAREQLRVSVESRARTVIVGPNGSGREQIARTIFRRREPESRVPLLPLACPLLDGESLRRTIASYLAADLGEPQATRTLLLLEADQLSTDAQLALAKFAFAPRVTLTTLATTSRSLLVAANESRFRTDLAAWLTTLEIEVPPLSARREDIPLAAQLAVELANARGNRQWSGLAPEAQDALAAYSWPGNFRQLVELVGLACEACDGVIVRLDHLPDVLRHAASAAAHPPSGPESLQLDALLLEVEREVLGRAIRKAKGNKAKAARLLGISRPRLLRRLEQLKIAGPLTDGS